jgi:poly(3-hydroxybutyrate) depolymerase
VTPYLLLLGITLLLVLLLVLGVWVASIFRKSSEAGMQTIEVDGEERTYHITWPDKIVGDHPLLLCFHGGLGSAEFFQKQTLFHQSGPPRGYVIVYPEAPEGWIDARPERGGSRKDLDFVDRLLDHLLLYPEIDPTRVFGVGSSNGGLFLYRLATDQVEQRFAGFAAALANMPVQAMENPRPGPPIPLLLAHGRRDFLMPFEGGELVKSKSIGKGGTVVSTATNLQFWLDRNKASPIPTRTHFGREPRLIEMLDFPPRPGGAPVRYIEIQNWGHRWPRWEAEPDNGVEAFDIAELIFDFFEKLSLPLAPERDEAPEPAREAVEA